jgi:hypothetical protein
LANKANAPRIQLGEAAHPVQRMARIGKKVKEPRAVEIPGTLPTSPFIIAEARNPNLP